MGQTQLSHFRNDEALAAAVAGEWLDMLQQRQAAGQKFFVALSGGRVTRKLFAAVVQQAQERGMSFQGAEFFWADERCVPPDDTESNFRLAEELLFRPARIPAAAIHRIRGEVAPGIGARQAVSDLCRVAGAAGEAMPVLDLVLLGMGEDGHVASLFPGDATTESNCSALFLPVENSPKPPPQRVTMGHGLIAAAREVWVLVSGQGKQAALHESLLPAGATPLAKLIHQRDRTRVFADFRI
jgi:6-phosphogluconolactonase